MVTVVLRDGTTDRSLEPPLAAHEYRNEEDIVQMLVNEATPVTLL